MYNPKCCLPFCSSMLYTTDAFWTSRIVQPPGFPKPTSRSVLFPRLCQISHLTVEM
jgi:hypothetical protein